MTNIKQVPVLILVVFIIAGCSNTKRSKTTVVYIADIQNTIASPYEEFQKIAGNKVYFTFDHFDLTKEARQVLVKQIDWLNNNQNTQIIIEGHCDEMGKKEYNYTLGLKRAHSVKDFLENHGINKNRISVVSYGKTKPDKIGHNEYSHRANRRAVTVIIK